MKCAFSSFHAMVGVLTAIGGGSVAHAQTGLLNDTGQTSCYISYYGTGQTVACNDAANVGNGGYSPHQDGRYGRDVAAAAGQLTKTGGGVAGFDFTRICWNGAAEGAANCTGTLAANTTGTADSASPATDWACTRDNVTGLVWSLQTLGAMNWTAAQSATANDNTNRRCGYSDWRLPIRRELLNIVNNGGGSPAIDGNYFPATRTTGYWSTDVSRSYSNIAMGFVDYAWIVGFGDGGVDLPAQTDSNFVRLVR
ncbi:MAG: DUF1566 domain-containing protein [Sulfuricella sp.]|nr:DUF1566 domain-containing protein [Sulfuricella sp.]